MSSSESSYRSDEPPRKKRRRPQKRKQSKSPIGAASKQINFICNNCETGFQFRSHLLRHIARCEFIPGKKRHCEGKAVSKRPVICGWCNLTFKNRGNLATHAYFLHGDTSYKVGGQNLSQFNCNICKYTFKHNFQLTYHIRRKHFNLKARIPYAEVKKVNQVWFEKVLNSNNLIEIKKTGQNTLVMRKLEENSAIKVNNVNTNILDLSHIYPTQQKTEKVECGICKKMYVKRDFKKHVEEIHYNKKKHHCNNCNRSFKRSYHYIQHVCSKTSKVRGVKQFDSNLRITSIESLSIPFE